MTPKIRYFFKSIRPFAISVTSLIAGMVVLITSVYFTTGAVAEPGVESKVKIPPPASDVASAADAPETAAFAGGCFWGVQAVFQHTKGVLNAVSGYAGGEKDTANYSRVSSGKTGHAESVLITYDPKQISYGKLLQIYFSVAHDPTQLNRQYPDTGTQYRSAIFYRNDNQKRVAEQYIAQLDAAHVYRGKIVTQVSPLTAYYAAENYHQDYATLHPESAYIARFDLPKIANLKSMFPEQYREAPVLVLSQLPGNTVVGK
jgi:peptide-methionine (S)-S-oxide reductase